MSKKGRFQKSVRPRTGSNCGTRNLPFMRNSTSVKQRGQNIYSRVRGSVRIFCSGNVERSVHLPKRQTHRSKAGGKSCYLNRTLLAIHGNRCYLHVASQSLTHLFNICNLFKVCIVLFLLQDIFSKSLGIGFRGKKLYIFRGHVL